MLPAIFKQRVGPFSKDHGCALVNRAWVPYMANKILQSSSCRLVAWGFESEIEGFDAYKGACYNVAGYGEINMANPNLNVGYLAPVYTTATRAGLQVWCVF